MKKVGILNAYFGSNQKPKEIARSFRVTPAYVSRVVQEFKSTLVKQSQQAEPVKKVRLSQDPQLLGLIKKRIEEVGLYNTTTPKLRQHLLQVLPSEKVPSLSTIHKILRQSFRLRFRKTNLSKFRYRDPTYNEKRLYVSRLLA